MDTLFHWPAWSSQPYLVTPKGKIIYLEVDGYIPYLYLDDGDPDYADESALPAPEVDQSGGSAGSVESPLYCVPQLGAKGFLADFTTAGGPPLQFCTRRLTLDLHKRDIIGQRDITPADTVETLSGDFPDGSKDIITYIEYDPDKI